MKPTAIAQLVTQSAARFGERNPQQLKQLASRLGKVSPVDVLSGLLLVFTHGESAPQGSAAQELAGQLLRVLQPMYPLDVAAILRASLARYELSVEQFPQYLAASQGRSMVLRVLQQLEHEELSERECQAIQTMRFWLRVQASGQAQNEA